MASDASDVVAMGLLPSRGGGRERSPSSCGFWDGSSGPGPLGMTRPVAGHQPRECRGNPVQERGSNQGTTLREPRVPGRRAPVCGSRCEADLPKAPKASPRTTGDDLLECGGHLCRMTRRVRMPEPDAGETEAHLATVESIRKPGG